MIVSSTNRGLLFYMLHLDMFVNRKTELITSANLYSSERTKRPLSLFDNSLIPGAENRSAPQHNQIQPLTGRQPDAHLFL